MLNIRLHLSQKKIISKQLHRSNELVLYLLFYLLLRQFYCADIAKKNKKIIKTLLISPFHYKVAKKLIKHDNVNMVISINIKINKKQTLLYLFRHNKIYLPVNTVLFYKKIEFLYSK